MIWRDGSRSARKAGCKGGQMHQPQGHPAVPGTVQHVGANVAHGWTVLAGFARLSYWYCRQLLLMHMPAAGSKVSGARCHAAAPCTAEQGRGRL